MTGGGTRKLSTGQAEWCEFEGSRPCDSFAEVAQKSSRAAQVVQDAVVETDVKDAGARAFVRLAEGDMDDLEAEIAASGLDGEHSVREAVHLARRRLRKVSGPLGGPLGEQDKEDAGRSGKSQARIETMVARHIADSARSEISNMRQVLVLETT